MRKPQKSHRKATEKPLKSLNKNVKNDENEKYNNRAKRIIDHLNQKAEKNYRYGNAHISVITARLKEGYTEEDCQKVIDLKVSQWLNTENEKYLRPETLFKGSKFDGYLNERIFTKKQAVVNHMTVSNDFSFEERIEQKQREQMQTREA